MKKHSLFLIFLLFSPVLACAGWVDKNGNFIPDELDRKSIGKFGAWLVLTEKEKQAFSNWNTPSASVYIPSTKNIEKGKILSALILFSGCAVDDKGNCNLVVKYKILQPNGTIYADLPYQEVWVDKPVPPNRNLGMGIGYVRVIIEEDEPLGKYTVEADVLDKNMNKSLNLAAYFLAIENKVKERIKGSN